MNASQEKLTEVAEMIGVSREDLQAFLGGVRFFMDKGLTFDHAVLAHAQTMQEGCELFIKKGGML